MSSFAKTLDGGFVYAACVSCGSHRESCAAAEIIRFRGPVREIGCVGAYVRVRRCEIVAGVGNPWVC